VLNVSKTITEVCVPTYSYACTECGDRFNVVQAFSDDALTTCEKCSGRLRKLFGKVGVVFKGSGFYRTDSREAAKSASNGAAKSSSEGSGSTSEASGDKSSSGDKPASPEKSNGSSSSSDKSGSGSSSKAAATTSS
jgi:putative FmdB family regulatory protein